MKIKSKEKENGITSKVAVGILNCFINAFEKALDPSILAADIQGPKHAIPTIIIFHHVILLFRNKKIKNQKEMNWTSFECFINSIN